MKNHNPSSAGGKEIGSITGKISGFLAGNMEVLFFIAAMLYKSLLFNRIVEVKNNSPYLYIGSLGAILIMAGFALWLKRKWRIKLLIAIDVAATIVMIGDMVFYRYFNDVISTPVLMQVVLMDSLSNSIASLFRRTDILFVMDIVIFIAAYALTFRRVKQDEGFTKRKRTASAAIVIIAGFIAVTGSFINVNTMVGNTALIRVFDHTYFVENVGILNFHGFDAISFAGSRLFGTKGLSVEEKEKIRAELSQAQACNAPKEQKEAKLNGAAKGYNLIVVQVEAMQNMVINMKMNGKEVTPNLNKFIKRSIYFNNYYSETAQGGTSDAEFLSNTSYFPLPEGAVYFQRASNTFESLPKTMKENGYKTFVMHPFRASYWNRSTMYPVLGFDRFVKREDFAADELLGWGVSDKSFFRQCVDIMKNEKEPFYSFLITLSSHYPYDAFNDSTEFDAGKFNKTFYGNYIKSMNYADKALGSFIEYLEKSGLMENSVLAIYGDHAAIQREKLEDMKDCFQQTGNLDVEWMNMVKVPLIVHLPGDKGAENNTVVGGQVDLFPTLMNLYGISTKYCMGRDLLNTKESFAILRDGSVTDGKTVYSRKPDKCFDMKSGEEVDRRQMEEIIQLAAKKLNTSDLVLKNNLIKYFEDKK